MVAETAEAGKVLWAEQLQLQALLREAGKARPHFRAELLLLPHAHV